MSAFGKDGEAVDVVAVRQLAQAGREVALPAKHRGLVEQLCDAIDGLADEVERLRRERGASGAA
jgi:hypothetical protein